MQEEHETGVLLYPPETAGASAKATSVRTTEALRAQKTESKALALGVAQRLQPGDIIFFDGQNDGSAVIQQGNEGRSGIDHAGRFTHVSIVVDIDPATGQALIAEAGGGGIALMRQATIRDKQTGQVFRPKDASFKKHIVRMAVDSTMSFSDDPKKDYLDWPQKDYSGCHEGPYAILSMLASPAASKINQSQKQLPLNYDRFLALHRPGFKKSAHESQSTFRAWCSKYVLYILVGAKMEQISRLGGAAGTAKGRGITLDTSPITRDNFAKLQKQALKQLFPADSELETSMRYVAPKTLWSLLCESVEFTYAGDWISNDPQNFYYNGHQKDAVGARPFLANTFAFKDYCEAINELGVAESSVGFAKTARQRRDLAIAAVLTQSKVTPCYQAPLFSLVIKPGTAIGATMVGIGCLWLLSDLQPNLQIWSKLAGAVPYVALPIAAGLIVISLVACFVAELKHCSEANRKKSLDIAAVAGSLAFACAALCVVVEGEQLVARMFNREAAVRMGQTEITFLIGIVLLLIISVAGTMITNKYTAPSLAEQADAIESVTSQHGTG